MESIRVELEFVVHVPASEEDGQQFEGYDEVVGEECIATFDLDIENDARNIRVYRENDKAMRNIWKTLTPEQRETVESAICAEYPPSEPWGYEYRIASYRW